MILSGDGIVWAAAPLSDGAASATEFGPTTAAGTYTMTAAYSGDANNNPATGSTVLTITKATPIITWSMPATIAYGTALTSTQLDAAASVPGTFAYKPAAGTVLGAESQTLSVTFTPTDTTDYNTVTATTSLTVDRRPAAVAVTSTLNPSIYGDTVTFTATVTPGATGTVTFSDGSTSYGPYNLTGSAAPFVATASSLATGSHTITATYNGDANYY